MNRFVYVEGFYTRKSGRKTKWTRVHLNDVEEKVRRPARNYNCFTTVQRFANAIGQSGELQYCDLYFDFDGDLEECRTDAMSVINFFSEEFEMPPETIKVFFSGSKGFHVLVNAQALGCKPHSELTYIHREAALWLMELLELSTLDHRGIYSIKRMLRLPDSIHAESGLFKVELTHEEIQNCSIKQIKKLAGTPRGDLSDTENETVAVVDEAAEWYKEFVGQYDRQKALRKLHPRKKIKRTESPPVCVSALLDSTTIPVSGRGNQAALALASYFKDVGLSEEETLETLIPWVSNLKNVSSSGDPRRAVASLKTVVKSVFEGDYYFACAFIRAIGDKENPIPCEYQNCKTTTPENQIAKDPIKLQLAEASRAEFVGQPVLIDVMISGKDVSPYIVPKRFAVKCSPDPKYCETCRLKQFDGYYECEFEMTEPSVLEMMRCGQDALKGALRRKAGTKPRCSRHVIEVLDHFNVEEVRLIPQVTFSYDDHEYAVRQGYYIGHGLKTNREVQIQALTVPHPKTQYAIHVFDRYESAETDVSIVMTPTLKKQLSIFQVGGKQTVEEKLNEIHNDLAANVTRVWGRETVAFAIDLIYHTALSFHFQETLVRKGWGELLIIGDSGQAKSTLASELRRHYQAGELINGEAASRTGLVYSLQESDNRWMLTWGRIPLNDRRLLFIDEFGGVPQNQIAEMSGLRTSGIAEVTKVISARTAARTRLIFMSNPRTGRPIATYDYAVQAIAGSHELIDKMEDVRRFDFAVCCRSGEVSEEVINRKEFPEVRHRFTNSLCNHLVRWAWSRKAEEVEFEPDATEAILDYAVRFSREYHSSIPLVEAADQRLKFARLSVGCAARLFSTDKTGTKIIVKKEHVEFVVELLRRCFHSLDYDTYSEAEYRATRIPDKKAKEIEAEFKELPDWEELRGLLISTRYFRRRELEDMMGYDSDTAKHVVRFLSSHQLIESTTGGYRKREFFISMLKKMKKGGGRKERF